MPRPGERNALSLDYIGGHIDIVDKLLSKDCNADDRIIRGYSFIWTVGKEHRRIISNITRLRNVNINHLDEARRTAISWAARDRMTDILARPLKLPEIDANVTDNKGKSTHSWEQVMVALVRMMCSRVATGE